MERCKMSDASCERFEKHCHSHYEYIFFVQADCDYVVEERATLFSFLRASTTS